MSKDVIIACDFPTAAQTLAFLDRFTEEKPFVKIGMELFYAEGPEIVRQIKARRRGGPDPSRRHPSSADCRDAADLH